jgi:hypothetical protein
MVARQHECLGSLVPVPVQAQLQQQQAAAEQQLKQHQQEQAAVNPTVKRIWGDIYGKK